MLKIKKERIKDLEKFGFESDIDIEACRLSWYDVYLNNSNDYVNTNAFMAINVETLEIYFCGICEDFDADIITELLNQQDKQIKELEEELDDAK